MDLEWLSSLIALVSFMLFVLVSVKSQKSAESYSHIPGPRKLPLIGNLHQMLSTSNLHHLFRDLGAKYGPLMHLQLGELHFLIVSSLEISKPLLTTHDIDFADRPRPNLAAEILAYNYSEIVYAPYGDYWRHVKKLLTVELLSTKRVRSSRHIREEESKQMAKTIASCEGSPINLSERVYTTSYNIITRASVGTRSTDSQTPIIPIIQEVVKLSSGFGVAELYPSIKFLPWITGIRYKYHRMRRRVDTVVGNIIQQHREARDDDTLADVLLKFQEDNNGSTENPITDDNIKGLLVGIFVAGSDTSPTVVEWAMSEMIKNPRVQKKAQDEVRKVFDGNKGYVDEEKFNELEYLKLVIKETLRLHPPAPLLVPRTNHQKCEINGYEIPAKSRVIINAWALGRDTKCWGDEAEEFIPERFGEKEMDYKGNSYEYLPFGSGRRACPGISFGVASVEFTLATLLYHFDWKIPNGIQNEDLDMTEEFGASVGRKHPLHLIPTIRRPLKD